MYNSQYYTCEQVDQRLLQGYLDDYNSENHTSLTKSQFLSLLATHLNSGLTTSNIVQESGNNTNKLMSQAIVTQLLSNLHSQINTESNNRSEADQTINYNLSTLSNNLNTESNNRETADQNINTQIGYYECNNEASATKKEVTITGYILPSTSPFGGHFKVKMLNSHGSDTPATLSVNNTGGTNGIPLRYNGEPVTKSNTWDDGEVIAVYYDGQYYQASNAQGGSNRKINAYLYGDLRNIEIGQTYYEGEAIKTIDKQLLRIKKAISNLSLTDEVDIGDLKVYNNNTYRAQKEVKLYNNNKYSDGDYALGAPAKLSLSIVRAQNGGEVVVTIGSNTITVTTTDEDEIQDVVSKIVQELNGIENVGWAFNIAENTIVATCDENGDNSDTLFSIVGGAGTGVTGTVEITSAGTADSEEGAGDGTPTVLTMIISLGVGSVNVTVGSITNTIAVNNSDTAASIASKIAVAEWEGWNLSVDLGDITKVIAISDNVGVGAGVPSIAENIFGISGIGVIEFAGSTKLCKYDESLGWNTVTLAQYAADSGENAMWSLALDIESLIEYAAEQNSINKELKEVRDEIVNDEYVLAMQALKQQEKNERYENKLEEKPLTDVEYVVARAVGDHERRLKDIEENGGGGSDSGGSSSLNGVVKTNNSDTICVIGSSFGVGYTISGKHWVNIVSMYSDYSVQNLSADGSSNLTRLQALRNGSITPAAKAKYALLVNSENLGGGQTVLLSSFVNLAKVIMSYGITPICGTSYRPADGARQMHFYFCSLLRNWCKQNNIIFMDAAQYRLIVGNGYNFEKPGNTHLGTRQIPLVAYAYMDALSGLERPFQSLKTFTKRNEVFVNDLDDLMFSDNYGRARVFKEAKSYKDYALISAILPATTKNLNSIKLSFGTTNNVNVYVINTIAKPFPSAPTYTRFHIDTVLTTNPEVNDVYTYGGKQFTVIKVETEEDQHYGAYCDIYCDPPLPSSEEDVSGTLTKVSGNGDSEIVFSSYGIATLASGDAAVVNADTIGHWELVEPDEEGGNVYTISNLIAKVSIDKINFLVECEGSFSLSNISVAWDATALKTNYQRTPKDDFTTNSWNSNAEIITEPTFGAVGTALTTWKDENGEAVVSEATYEQTLTGKLYTPSGQAVIKVGPTHYAQMVVSKSSLKVGRIVIEVIARFFGDGITTGFVDGSETVNSDTFDWAQLTVMVGGGELTYGRPTYGNYVYPIGLYWRIIRIPVDILGSERYNMRLRLFADRNGVEIAKVSLKYI